MQYDNKSFQSALVSFNPIWIVGSTGSGKTTRLIKQFQDWAAPGWQNQPVCLVFAALGDNRLTLAERIAETTQGRYPFDSVTPLSFFQNEVMLFWPLLMQRLGLKTQFPLRLRPETEQELATRLWRPELESGRLRQAGVRDHLMVQRTLNLLQVAAASGTPHEQIPLILQQGFSDQEGSLELWNCMGKVLERWWQWCLDRGLLTYSILTELYWRYLLPHPTYQQHLKQRYQAVLADDVDEYPAVARTLFEFFLDQGIPTALTFNPTGSTRLGLGADPDYMAGLAQRCRVETLAQKPEVSLGSGYGQTVVESVREPLRLLQLPDAFQLIQTTSKAQLLRQTAETIAAGIQSGAVQPQDIAIISPGLDAITRYTLQAILSSKGVSLFTLNSQQPLISSPLVRALLSLLAMVYPGLGRYVDRELIAEMLVVLGQIKTIDPVRAGLLTDFCFIPDLTLPRLLSTTNFPRWDRLGYQATQAYGEILEWIEAQRHQQQLRPSPVALLDQAIQRFFLGGSDLPFDQLTNLQKLLETAQHYWEVDTRLRQYNPTEHSVTTTVGQFIQLLRDGAITANAHPARPVGKVDQAVTLATVYQYRNDRRFHRWQFWLDAGSALWLTGSVTLFGAPLFLRNRLNRVWTSADALAANQDYLEREIFDLLNRATERVYLCHCELAVNGQEQAGALMPLVDAAVPVSEDLKTA